MGAGAPGSREPGAWTGAGAEGGEGRSLDRELREALQDGLAGRKALLRAYEAVIAHVDDEDVKRKLEAFAEEEREEYLVGEALCQRLGADPGRVRDIRNEVMAFLGRRLFTSGESPLNDARQLAILYGMESTGHLGAEVMKEIAERQHDPDWVAVCDRSIERSQAHMEFLHDCATRLIHEEVPVEGTGVPPTRAPSYQETWETSPGWSEPSGGPRAGP